MIDFVTVGQFILSILGAGTVGGLASGELNRRLATRENRQKHLGGLLCDLLELRHGIIGIREITKAITPLIPGQGDQFTVAMPVIIEAFVNSGKLHEHYEAAVVELASIDPILAYDLRSKNLTSAMLGPISKTALQAPATIHMAAQALKIFQDAGMSALDEAILRVATELGRSKHRQVRKILEQKPEMPQQASQVFALIPGFLQAEQHAQAQAAELAKTQAQGNENSGAKAAKATE